MNRLGILGRIGYIVLGSVQNMTMGGIIYGWASISNLLLSKRSEGGVGLTPSHAHALFVVASFFGFLGPLALGIVLDKFGPRICSVISISCIILGSICFISTSKTNSLLFAFAICLIGNTMLFTQFFSILSFLFVMFRFRWSWCSKCCYQRIELVPKLEILNNIDYYRLLSTIILCILFV
jgi:hypothetical protein